MVGTSLETLTRAVTRPDRDQATLSGEPESQESGDRVRNAGPTTAAVCAYVVVIGVASRWGEALLAQGTRLQIATPPLNGAFDWRPGRTVLPAAVCGLVLMVVLPRFVDRWRWSTVLGVAGLAAIAWAVALALVDGSGALTQPLLSNQYLATVGVVGNLGTFLHTFSHRLATYNIHTQGHPPGMVVVLWLMDRVGLGGVRWNSALVFGSGGLSVVAVLVAVREVAGEAVARRAVPFLVLAPAAVAWTSADPFFAAVSAWAVTAMIAATGRTGRRRDGLAVVGGVLFACTAWLSYGLVLLVMIPGAVAVRRRQVRVLTIAAAVVGALLLLVWSGTGFSWWEGLAATRAQYFAGAGGRRPYGYFLLANLAAFAIAVGPATAVGLTRLRREPLALLVGAAVAVVLLADVSGMSKAEVERIWLPFVPWVMAAGAVLATRLWRTRMWLAVQLCGALVVAVAIRSPW